MQENQILKDLQSLEGVLKTNYGITKLALFGSYATNTATVDSDIDILIMHMEKKNGFTIARAQRFLSEYFHKDVDLGLYDSIRPFIKTRIENEIIYV